MNPLTFTFKIEGDKILLSNGEQYLLLSRKEGMVAWKENPLMEKGDKGYKYKGVKERVVLIGSLLPDSWMVGESVLEWKVRRKKDGRGC